MSCAPLMKGQKVVGVICFRDPPPTPCYICGKPATRLCDYPVEDSTCDRPMCRKHTHKTGRDIDYCWKHYQEIISTQTKLNHY